MNDKVMKELQKLQKEGKIITGKVLLVEHSDKYDSDVLQIELPNGLKGVMTREDFDVKVIKQSLVPYVGRKIQFQIKDIEADGTLVCSRKEIKEKQRDELIEKLNAGAEFNATITHIERFGAYMTINGTSVFMRNMDFADDHTIVSDMHKVGDTVKVKLFRVTSTKRILVQAVKKYCNPTTVDFSTFTPQQVVYGRVRTVKSWGCYVCIAPNLDALAPIPEDTDVELQEGMSVSLKISKVDPELGRVRGRILKIIPDGDLDLEM